MQLMVFVEQIDEQTYRAATAQPVALATEGRTRVEAVERLRTLAQQRLHAGEMVQVDLPEIPPPHSWLPFAGIWHDHPDFEAVLEHIAASRRTLDAAEREA